MDWRVGVTLIIAILISIGWIANCIQREQVRQDLRDANEATYRSLPPEAEPLVKTIPSYNLRIGDCFNSGGLDSLSADETVDVETVVLVPCSMTWDFKVVSSFNVFGSFSSYPGDDYFFEEAQERCDQRYTVILFPLKESWDLGDRTVNCLEEPGLGFNP